jgi:hypothetical protein
VPYCAMHLAVLGELDTMNKEASLGGWIRAGGLWRPAGPHAGAECTVGSRRKESVRRRPQR